MIHPGPFADADIAFGDALIAEVRRAGSQDHRLMGIVAREISHFFSGEISAEEAARAVQSEVGIYLSE